MGVEDVLRAEARDKAEDLLDARIARIAKIGNIRTETAIREGRPAEEIEQLDRRRSRHRHPGAGRHRARARAPGPLVSAFANRSAATALPVLITIVPAQMTDEQIVAIS